MAASFPNAKKTFSAVVNGVTKLVAALFNSPYDEVEAIETFIGPTGGGALAYTESLTNILLNYRRGCNVEYKGAADLYVRAGEIMITDASGNKRFRRNTSDTTVTWANIDTGSEANATYYVYAVADASATTFTVMISTNATTPTGATFYRRLGRFANVSGDISRKSFVDDLYGSQAMKISAMVKFSPSDGSIISSYNVSGVTKNSTGNFTVSWDVDFADTTYCVFIANSTNSTVIPGTVVSQEAGSCVIAFGILPNGAAADPATAIFVIAVGFQ